MKYIASCSFGKDSLAMILKLIELGEPLDEVVFYDTGMEFQAIYNLRDKIKPLLEQHGIKYVELKPQYSFLWKMFEKPVDGKNGFHYGYSWCGGTCRWGTTDKLQAIEKYCKGSYEYIGIAVDELHRVIANCDLNTGKWNFTSRNNDKYKKYPLCEMNMTEKDCLRYCYSKGFNWLEEVDDGTIDLYNILDRVSCWCCANKNLKELRNIYLHLPTYWEKLKGFQMRTDRPMKGEGKSVFDLEKRFELEKEFTKQGKPITNKEFYQALKSS